MFEENGHAEEAKGPPTIEVIFDPQNQVVAVKFDPTEFKTWDFVIAALEMAKQSAESNKRLAQMQAMQQQQSLAQQQNQLLQSRLRRGL